MIDDAFIRQAWTDHNDRPVEVAERLLEAHTRLREAGRVPALARIVTHVFGEHLARWNDGIALLSQLKSNPCCDGEGARSLDQGIGALRLAAGDEAALDRFAPSERIGILATASSALAAQGETGRAIRAYEDALAIGERGLPAGDPGVRALAVGGNNLAASLETKQDRSAGETRAMVNAAAAALKYWALAGTWLETERAEYRLAKSLLAAGDLRAAVDHARRCVEICEANDAPAGELSFAHELLAIAQAHRGAV